MGVVLGEPGGAAGAGAPERLTGAASLDRADAARYLLVRLEDYDGGFLFRGMGPDPAGRLRERPEQICASSFGDASGDASLAILRQTEASADTDSELFAVTFRQLLCMSAAREGRMSSLAEPGGAEVMFPVLTSGLDAESRPVWKFTGARLVADRLGRSGCGHLCGDRSQDVRACLRDAADRAAELRGGRSCGMLMDMGEKDPQVQPVATAGFWAPYFTGPEVAAPLQPGSRGGRARGLHRDGQGLGCGAGTSCQSVWRVAGCRALRAARCRAWSVAGQPRRTVRRNVLTFACFRVTVKRAGEIRCSPSRSPGTCDERSWANFVRMWYIFRHAKRVSFFGTMTKRAGRLSGKL
ncbi:MAG: hypothetical protein LBT40_14895 [Deltaproteobacteria bacterium]|jgi:hypothetical protein|nr:hypothetical protein [Deltaproteobacteria bacterium]